MSSINKYLKEFGKPFASEDVRWRIQYTNNEKTKGFAVPYADSRAIADRFDQVVGQLNWQDTYSSWHNVTETDKNNVSTISSQLCTISIYDEKKSMWINKTDGASDTDIEPVKGGLTDSFKRAATKWNIGRYLYKFDGLWVDIEQRGKGFVIKDSEKNRLAKHYNDSITRLFKTETNAPKQSSKPPEANETGKSKTVADEITYEVQSVKVSNAGSNTNTKIQMARNDETIVAFLIGKNEKIKSGTKLKNIQLKERNSDFGKYHIIEKYEIAA